MDWKGRADPGLGEEVIVLVPAISQSLVWDRDWEMDIKKNEQEEQ